MTTINDIRVDIGDDTSPYRISDSQIIVLIEKSARRINRILNITGTSDEILLDSSGNMTTSDNDLYDILLLQTECLIANRDMTYDINSQGAGLLVKDGEQQIDTSTRARIRADLLKTGPCAELDKQLLFEKLKRTSGYDIW